MTEEQEPKHHFNKDSSWFLRQINSRKRAMPVFAIAASMVTKRSEANLLKFIEVHSPNKEYDADGTISKYTIPTGMNQRYSFLKSSFDDFAIFSSSLPRMALISIVSLFDAYLTRLLKNVYLVKPELLNGCTRQIDFSELVGFGSVDAAREHIIDKEIESVLRESHAAQFSWLEKKLNVKLTDLPSWKDFIELTERRNLLVHADGKVSSHYLEICKSHKIDIDSGLKRGDQLEVGQDYYQKACNCVTEIGIKLNQVLWRKLIPEELEQAENSFIQSTYDLLLVKEYQLAEKILDITKNGGFKKLNFETALYLTINHAISLKGQEKEKECIALLKKTDFSALSYKFKIANQVLTDKFDDAAETMRKIGPDGELSESQFREWPLFRWFRKTEQFKTAFKDIYGNEYVVIEEKWKDSDDDDDDDGNGDGDDDNNEVERKTPVKISPTQTSTKEPETSAPSTMPEIPTIQ
ncbi:hypothetical protein QF019_002438 [Pseudomonas frederiksbergensis]|uniref:hypothetical protein n=1 Tax=Pseudomonas frederiksbergensis TaxID=104087 RepID=UPI003D1D0FE3